MNNPAGGKDTASEGVGSTLYKKDFWSEENLKYAKPHYRMEKVSRLINKIAKGQPRTLLDVGCGPATLRSLLAPGIQYHGIDIAIQDPAPNLVEADLIKQPISFGDKRFDIVIAQGFFEYVGKFQSQKFAEIAKLLAADGVFIATYVNFDHRNKDVYWPYSNVQPFREFRKDVAEHFKIKRCYPTSYHWNHWEPSRRFIKGANMRINFNIPVIAPVLGVEYILICSARESAGIRSSG